MEINSEECAPTPWKVITTPRKGKHAPKGLAIQAANGLIFADFHDGHGASGDEAIVQFIVRACNAHAALLEAMRNCITEPGACCFTKKGRLRGHYKTKRLDEITRIARSAIK